MDESDMRALLHNLAGAEAPPARIDIGAAISQGRRVRRWRAAGAGGSTLAVAAAAGAVVTMVAVPGHRTGLTPGAGGSSSPAPSVTVSDSPIPMETPSPTGGPVTAPTHFNPLVPYASFGWLPAGYTASGTSAQLSTTTQSVSLSAQNGSSGGTAIQLTVNTAGACTTSGSSLPVLTCTYSDGSSLGAVRATSVAPAVNGRPAFWAEGEAKDSMLIWEYAPGAWSVLMTSAARSTPPSASERTMLSQVAANVRYADSTPIQFPFWLTGVPAGWTASSAEFTESSSGELVGQSLGVSSRLDPGALGISIVPTLPGNSCKFISGQSRYVTLDGTKAVLRTLDEPGKGYQSLCAADVSGMQVYVSLDTTEQDSNTPLPGVSGLGGALGVAKALHLLGTDPSGWTTNPLR